MNSLDEASWKSTFFKKDFSVDQCLADFTQKSDLESLRRDLKNYGTELQLQMSEILKNETEAIVNLAEYLTNLNSKIDNLSIPISQLKEEIKNLFELIISVEETYNTMLEDIKANNLKQNHIHLKLGIVNSCVYVNSVIDNIEKDLFTNLCNLERIVNKFSFQKMYLCELSLMTCDIENIIKNVEEKLVHNANKCFLSAFKERDKDILLKCLRMYLNLQKEEEAHNNFKTKILRPALQPLFTERYLEKQGQNLDKIYTEVKNILENKVDLLSAIIQDNPDLNSFNFVLKSFWVEFHVQSTQGLPHVTAPGNPELFQKRFISTYNLLKYIAEKGGDKSLVSKNESFQSNLKRFNLPVYFEIKFQQIAGNFESELFNCALENIYTHNPEDGFMLRPSLSLNNALQSCFHENVYIDQLADQFIKLSIMLLSRYVQCIRQTSPMTTNMDKHDADKYIVNCLIDLHFIQNILAPRSNNVSDIDKTMFSVVNRNIWHIIMKLFKANSTVIGGLRTDLEEYIISSKVEDSVVELQKVKDIPRLYRRTNRTPPKEASGYMTKAVDPILHCNNTFKAKLQYQSDKILDDIIKKITNQYLKLVEEVLMSVSKIEDSLRKLKSRTLYVSSDYASPSQTDSMSDETKIQEQIKYDVDYFYDKLHPIGSAEGRLALQDLKTITLKYMNT